MAGETLIITGETGDLSGVEADAVMLAFDAER
jgi:hypothetical protein